MSDRTLIDLRPAYQYEDLPDGHALLEIPTPPNLPVAQYLRITMYSLAAVHHTYEAFRTIASSERTWPPDYAYGRFERDRNGGIRFTLQAYVIGESPDQTNEEDHILRVSGWRYGSPTCIDLTGIPSILEMQAGSRCLNIDTNTIFEYGYFIGKYFINIREGCGAHSSV